MLESLAEPRTDGQGAPPEESPDHILPTRFGPIPVDERRVVRLPHGLFGFAHRTLFTLAELPERGSPFKLLQSVEDPALGLLVLPLDPAGGMIRPQHLAQAATQAGIGAGDLVALAVVTLRAVPGDVRCTANLKAPILLDSVRRVGVQHVLASDDYEVRHPLALNGEAG